MFARDGGEGLELGEGQRQYGDFHIAAGQISRQLSGEKGSVGPGQIDVARAKKTKTIDDLLPTGHLLDFVKEEIIRMAVLGVLLNLFAQKVA